MSIYSEIRDFPSDISDIIYSYDKTWMKKYSRVLLEMYKMMHSFYALVYKKRYITGTDRLVYTVIRSKDEYLDINTLYPQSFISGWNPYQSIRPHILFLYFQLDMDQKQYSIYDYTSLYKFQDMVENGGENTGEYDTDED
jgi:hypothetical protein